MSQVSFSQEYVEQLQRAPVPLRTKREMRERLELLRERVEIAGLDLGADVHEKLFVPLTQWADKRQQTALGVVTTLVTCVKRFCEVPDTDVSVKTLLEFSNEFFEAMVLDGHVDPGLNMPALDVVTRLYDQIHERMIGPAPFSPLN